MPALTAEGGQKVELVEGLQPGDRIVLRAAYLKDGDQVAIDKNEV